MESPQTSEPSTRTPPCTKSTNNCFTTTEAAGIASLSNPTNSMYSFSTPCLPSHSIIVTEVPSPFSNPISPRQPGSIPPPPSPAVRLQEFLEDERDSVVAAYHRLYGRLSEWIGKKNTERNTRLATEQHAKSIYGIWTEKDKQDMQASKRKLSLVTRRMGSSLEEGRTLLTGESGYSSPNFSTQPTPTASIKLATPALRRSLELHPYRNLSHPRMSLPSEHLRSTIDGRLSAQASEKRSRLIRERRVSQDDEPILKIDHSRRRLSKHGGSYSREESAGEESGFEEEDALVEIRVPPCVIEERRDSNSSCPSVHDNNDRLSEFSINWDDLRFTNIVRKGSSSSIFRSVKKLLFERKKNPLIFE